MKYETSHPETALPPWASEKFVERLKLKVYSASAIITYRNEFSLRKNLLEKGNDIRHIKDLLGHFDSKTTKRYLHVAKQKLVNIISPLDDLVEKGGITW